jgi:glycosyltransferase involved in cell wall biosynthesis
VRSHLWASDAFVLASEQEGMPTSVLEAMACQIACIAPASAGGDQLLQDGAGIIPTSGEPIELEAALRQLACDPEHRRRLGARARDRVAAYTPRAVADAYEHIWGIDGRP